MVTDTLGTRILDAATEWAECVDSLDLDGQGRAQHKLRALADRADAAERLADDAAALVDRLLAIHEDGRYRLVWEHAQNHLGPYRGPFYTDELDKTIASLAAWRAIDKGVTG